MLRYLPHRTLPPYSYVPGEYPHPHRDPDGHSHGVDVGELNVLTESAWRECESYPWGVDLLNAGYYWEAHEAWEQAWIRVGRAGPIADFLKALIKLAAAGVKAREGREPGVRRHALRSVELLTISALQKHADFLGLSLDDLRTTAQSIADRSAEITRRATADNQIHALPVFLELQ